MRPNLIFDMPFSNKRNSRDDSPRRGKRDNDSFKPRSNDRSSSNFSSDRKQGKRFGEDKPFGKKEGFRDFEKRDGFKKKPFGDRDDRKSFGREDRGFDKRSSRDFDKKDGYQKKSYGDRDDRKSFGREDRGFDKRSSRDFDKKDGYQKKSYGDRDDRKSFDRKDSFKGGDRRPSRDFDKKEGFKPRKSFGREQHEGNDEQRTFFKNRKFAPAKKPATSKVEDDGLIRLNRYISNSGICSRRKADELIEAGVISVNGEVVTELGTKVDPAKDEVRYNNERLKREKMVYVLLNKPKDYITTTDDPQERKTVMQLVSKATKERIYPIGRLDRNTTGLLLLTNDGNLAEKLSHPRNNISKMYYVELDRNLSQGDLNKIQFGIELEDGFIKPDDISYVTGASKAEIGIQIHSGRNRIVRRIFESFGYEVVKLDRVVYANLTKKDLPRGRWRYLEERELIQLKHLIK